MTEILETALHWLRLGVATIPIRNMDKTPVVAWLEYKTQLPTEMHLRKWFGTGFCHNLGIITGHANLVVLDFDNQALYELWRGLYPLETFTVKSARGTHVYLFIDDQDFKPLHIRGMLDVQSHGLYVVAPPSTHASGAPYVGNGLPVARVSSLDDVLPETLRNVSQGTVRHIDDKYSYQKHTNSVPIPHTEHQPSPVDPWSQAFAPQPNLVRSIREKFDIRDFLTNVTPTSQDGRWYVATCPFHQPDVHPSFWVDAVRQVCSCHACKMREMDIVNLWSQLRKISNSDAIHELRSLL
jgi:hypothetical protein